MSLRVVVVRERAVTAPSRCQPLERSCQLVRREVIVGQMTEVYVRTKATL